MVEWSLVKNIVLKISSVLLLFYLEVCVLKIKRAKLNLRTKIFDGGGHGVMVLCFAREDFIFAREASRANQELG